MSRKIIGITVGTQLPKPNFKQTDPTKGDYIKNKPDFDGLKSKVNTIGDLVGDTSVSDQIGSAISNQVGIKTANGGEIFNDYENNIIENDDSSNAYAHAEGCKTTAGWRSHAEGYMTLANNTSHAEGRLTKATGKGSHAEGSEIIQEIKKSDGSNVLTTKPIDIDENTITVDEDISEDLHIDDYVTIAPTDTVTGFAATDGKRIIDIQAQSAITLDGNYHLTQPSSSSSFYCYIYNNEIEEGNYVSFSFDESGTKYLVTGINYRSDDGIPDVIHIEGECTEFADEVFNFDVYVYKGTTSTITLNAPFRAENYYEGHNAPEDGIIPAGAKLRKIINTTASNIGSHAEGVGTTASGKYSHSEGYGTTASGVCSHSEGSNTTASGEESHAEGFKTTASGKFSHAEGNLTRATKSYAHAEGYDTESSGNASHAEGGSCIAKGDTSHAEGQNCEANENASHAEGFHTQANGKRSHVEGTYTIASAMNQHVQGQYNVEDPNMVHIVGWGTSDADRKNIHTIDKEGNAVFTGEVTASNGRLISEEEARALIPEVGDGEEWYMVSTNEILDDDIEDAINYDAIHSHWPKVIIESYTSGPTHFDYFYPMELMGEYNNEGNWEEFYVFKSTDKILYIHTYLNDFVCKPIDNGFYNYTCLLRFDETFNSEEVWSKWPLACISLGTDDNNIENIYFPYYMYSDEHESCVKVFKCGDELLSIFEFEPNRYELSTVTDNHISKTNPTGTGSLSLNRKANTTTGEKSVAIGNNITASGKISFAEGDRTVASGTVSHAEGESCEARGDYSHAEGLYSVASGKTQHVQGRYPLIEEVSDTSTYGKYAHIVGNGTGTAARSNCHTLDWDGNAWYSGDVECTEVILKSPNGTRFKIAVGDDGTIKSTQI